MYSNTFSPKLTSNAQIMEAVYMHLSNDEPPFKELTYFKKVILKQIAESAKMNSRHPIVVLGTSIPEKLIYACNETPCWILGGDPGTVHLSDDVVPRDTDPVSRSAFGIIRNLPERYLSKALIVVPLINDSSRKLSYSLRAEGRKVCTVDISPTKTHDAEKLWLRQMEKLSEAFEKHTGRFITKHTLEKAQITVSNARQEMRIFSKAAMQNTGVISGTWRMLVMQSYYYTDDLEKWTERLSALSSKISKTAFGVSQPDKNRVLLTGSPIYFPNYKIPFLIEDAGMEIAAQLDYTSQRIIKNTQAVGVDLSCIANEFYQNDASDAYSKNDAIFNAAVRVLSQTRIDGVVYHVLKGQIEYDFELERLEELFSKHSIPICRLETDYSYQDIEQLRIRIDAFSEVLAHRKRRKEAYVV